MLPAEFLATPRPHGVLIADDEADVRDVLHDKLRREGFSVWLAADGQEALDLYRTHRENIDVVLLDVCMPGLDGPRTLAALQEITPQVRCCFMSGYLSDHFEKDLRGLGAAKVFAKPFQLDEVVNVLGYLARHGNVRPWPPEAGQQRPTCRGSLPRIVKRASRSTIALLVVAAAMFGIVNSRAQSTGDRAWPAPRVAARVSGEMTPNAPTPGAISDAAAKARLIELARRDPSRLLRLARERCQRGTGDFSCLFVKQERINGTLKPVEEIDARYRADPLSVFMIWRRGADQAQRALFIDRREFVDGDGHRLARVEPAGVLLRLIVSDLLVPIHDAAARQASRRAIDEFGFRSTFEILERVNNLAASRNELDFRYAGEGAIDGRATVILVRRLPYTGPGGPYPDATMILHLDQEWLLPTAVYSFTDPEGRRLLGSYVFSQVQLNPGFGETDFQF